MTRIDSLSKIDRVASQLLAVGRETRPMPTDLYRDGEHYVMHLDLPGVDPGSVDLQLDNQVLSIRAERTSRTAEGLEWLVHERPFGTYLRQITIGPGIELDAITATLEHGVLTLSMPIAERAKPRRIELQTTGSAGVEAPDTSVLEEAQS